MAGDSQFIRRWGLYVADPDSGNGTAIAEGTDEPGQETLHLRFTIHQADAQMLANYGEIRVYNPPADLIGKLKQYRRVVLQAGYRDGRYGKIFDGWISYFRAGREAPETSYLDLYVTDGDLGLTFGTVNKTLLPGANSAKDQVKVVTDEYGRLGIAPPDQIPEGGPIQPRATVLYGRASIVMENLRKTNGWLWSVQNGKLLVTENDQARAGEGVVLNAQTGLIGWPTVTPDGIEARCLLNPALYVKERVRLDNATINQAQGTGFGGGNDFSAVYPSPAAGFTFFAPTSSDGTYVAYVIEHRGDTRGNDWYSELVLWAIDSKSGKTLTQDGQVPTDAIVGKEASGSIVPPATPDSGSALKPGSAALPHTSDAI